ncbi:MAG TPA: ATP synthase F0 subunit B [Acidobacteriaceae bacterium]|nr:ATP synthase F0 subunit B [Acidobacteriaceae bacterium]
MRLQRTRTVLAAATLVLVLGFGLNAGLRAWERPVLAQAAGVASTPEAQSPAKNEQEQDENEAYRKSPMVQKLGGMLGMNPDQAATAFEVFNFALLAIAFGWLLAKTLPKAIRNRNTSIQKHLVDARTATEEARIRLSGVEERLSRLDGEIAGMRTQAEQETAKEEQRLKAALEEETKKILAAAEQEIASATIQARQQLQQHAAELAIEQAARKLVVTAETDRLLIQRFAQRFTGKGEN